jgi:ankyrin repeat protein
VATLLLIGSYFAGTQMQVAATEWTCQLDHLEVIALLLKYGANINATNHVSYAAYPMPCLC